MGAAAAFYTMDGAQADRHAQRSEQQADRLALQAELLENQRFVRQLSIESDVEQMPLAGLDLTGLHLT